MTSLSDLSQLTGYSKATVSRAISGNGYVSKEARALILKVAQDLDYATNAIAQDLASGRSRNIGVVLPYVKAPFFRQVLEGILEKNFETGYKIVILPSNYNPKLEIHYLEQFRKKAFEALIFTSLQVSEATILDYQKYGPIILCHKPQSELIPASYVERKPGYHKVFQWLKEQQCSKVGFLLSRDVSPTTSVTLQAYEEVYGMKIKARQVKTGSVVPDDGYQLAPQLTEFDSIFANSDDIAANVWRWFDEQKLPKHLIVGQDCLLSGHLLNLPTVDNHYLDVGRSAFELAISKEIKQLATRSEFIRKC
ncbi:LacI family DNA-binding transcriptional regulator [Lactococcus taiwanensis]|uniref:LacI family DNA-binding transcriptional regulator n=1 Tax=Lactococcus taiwanensis TaxID=1151742 RepID=UPI00289B5038|nr:LacI family DNA-binding transcriptional regulator [Lactococcus taiwanensis]